MNILLLCEGNAEIWDSWSGISRSIVQALRSAGHVVVTGDVDLYGAERLLGAAVVVFFSRPRLGTRGHLRLPPFRPCSRIARRHITGHPGPLALIPPLRA